jgi:hypothetical protein
MFRSASSAAATPGGHLLPESGHADYRNAAFHDAMGGRSLVRHLFLPRFVRGGTGTALSIAHDTLGVRRGKPSRARSCAERLWPTDTFVDFDHRLAAAVSKLWDALADSAEIPSFVETTGSAQLSAYGPVDAVDRASAHEHLRSGDEQMPAVLTNTVEISVADPLPHSLTQSTSKRRVLFSMGAFALLIVAAIVITKPLYLARTRTMQL